MFVKLRSLPKIDRLVAEAERRELFAPIEKARFTDLLRELVDEARQRILSGSDELLTEEDILELAAERNEVSDYNLRSCINCTGTVLHTNLGRAPLGQRAKKLLELAASGYTNLEYDLSTGERGRRYDLIEDYLVQLTDAEAAIAVNNNAAAVLLTLTALCAGKEVIVSRGELVEIGGSFRIPDVLKLSGATLVEVGTTNKTHLTDYQAAINENTAAILRVHTSNFRISGFTSTPTDEEIAELANEYGITAINDVGSGCLLQADYLGHEPTVPTVLRSGYDIVTFSGDKLLGGPQAGLIVGKRALIDKISEHQLLRALRIDKLSLAALEGTLYEYLYGNPAQRLLHENPAESKKRATRILNKVAHEQLRLKLTPTHTQAGGGSLPERFMAGFGIRIRSDVYTADEIKEALRSGAIPIIGRVERDALVLDMLCVQNADCGKIVDALNKLEIDRPLDEEEQ